MTDKIAKIAYTSITPDGARELLLNRYARTNPTRRQLNRAKRELEKASDSRIMALYSESLITDRLNRLARDYGTTRVLNTDVSWGTRMSRRAN